MTGYFATVVEVFYFWGTNFLSLFFIRGPCNYSTVI